MTYIVLDLEWNGAYSHRLKSYFNEIIEIGAVKIDDSLNMTDKFRAIIKPVFSRKLSPVVTDLTGIEFNELEGGQPFSRAISQLRKWIFDTGAVVMTWSTTDLLVLLENCNHFLNERQIPFLNYYVDLQDYCMSRLKINTNQQTGLFYACELLGIDTDDSAMHRALDDSILAAKVFQTVFEPDSFVRLVKPADSEFYSRLTFKNTIISDIKDSHINKSDLRFYCEQCGRRLRRLGKWGFRSRAFYAEFICKGCNIKYLARVQAKLKYDGVTVGRKLVLSPEQPQPEESELQP